MNIAEAIDDTFLVSEDEFRSWARQNYDHEMWITRSWNDALYAAGPRRGVKPEVLNLYNVLLHMYDVEAGDECVSGFQKTGWGFCSGLIKERLSVSERSLPVWDDEIHPQFRSWNQQSRQAAAKQLGEKLFTKFYNEDLQVLAGRRQVLMEELAFPS